MKDDNKRWFILGIIALILYSILTSSTILPKEAVADIEGQACSIDSDCPCLGQYNYTNTLTDEQATAWGIGTAQCKEGVCDTTFCVDIEPVGTWIKENPFQLIKDNILFSMGILALLIMVVVWPKK